jgi:trehalose 6-phosphate synthase
MNLVAKEAPLVNGRCGAVVLSENTGAYQELGDWTIAINPFDVEEQAHAIHEALSLPEDERRGRLEAIRAHVHAHDINAWIETQLDALDDVGVPLRR